jgi:hypothetical protein
VAKERAKGLAIVDARRAEHHAEVAAMHNHKETQEGHVELNIGGYHFQTSVQALRRIPHTFFDAYFSGRYAQDVCDDGSIFVDRDGEHFGHILEYMSDGYVSVAEPGARPSVPLLRPLKREFGFYCIELVPEQAAELEQPEVAYVMGGKGDGVGMLSSMERYDALSGQWSAVAAMGTARLALGACVVAGEIYVTAGEGDGDYLSSVEKYSPSSDTWSTVAPMPDARKGHAAVAMGSCIYVLGGFLDGADNVVGYAASVLRFDTTQGIWVSVAPMPELRLEFAASAVGTDIFVFGGWNNLGGDQYCVLKYDTVANEWSTLAPMPHNCSDSSACVLDGLIYIVGADDIGSEVHNSNSEVLRFDPVLCAWSTLALTLRSKAEGSSFVVGGYLYAAGGELLLDEMACVERYDVATNTWTVVADMLEGRFLSCTVTIGSAGPAEEQNLFDSLIAKASSVRP